MPRRRRNRRKGRKVYKQQNRQNGAKISNTIQLPETPVHVQESPKRDIHEEFVTLPNIVTPINTPSTPISQKLSNFKLALRDNSLPRTKSSAKSSSNLNNEINYRKQFHRNLNESLEDSVFDNVTPKRSRNFRNESPFGNKYINNLNEHLSDDGLSRSRFTSAKIRSNSSMSKLRCPGLDKIPIMVDVATQTVYFDNSCEKQNTHDTNSDIYLQSCINIFETPKISQLEKLEQAYKLETPLSYTSKNEPAEYPNLNRIDISVNNKTNLKYLQNLNDIIFPNAYISPKVMQKINNNESDSDISFFSPQLKTVSTPIEKLHKTDRILENMAKNILSAQLDRKLQSTERQSGYIYNNFSPKTPNNKNLNMGKCENKIFTQKINKLDSCVSKRRIYNSVSPKKLKDVSGRLFNNSKNNSYIRTQTSKNDSGMIPKTFSPQRGSFNRTNNILNVSNSSMYRRFMTNVKKLHSRYSMRWFNVVKDVCSGLGITVKQKLSSMCIASQDLSKTTVTDPANVQPQAGTCYHCRSYEEQIVMLSTKVMALDKELRDNIEKIMDFDDEMGKIKQEITELEVIKTKIRELEEKFEKIPATAPSMGSTPPPPPPPPIPPPPPPIPSSVSSPSVIRNMKAANSKKIEKKHCENSRPVISLNDILNVKLRKTSDKPHLARRITQPFISVEMLNQIKLRPASKPQTPCSIKDASTPSSLSSSSPASSLTKLLSNVDPSIRRLKRLRKIGRYSLDDSRKHLLRRERNNIDDA